MSLPECDVNVNIIENLPDAPNLPASELKQKFDEAGKGIKNYLNTVLTKEIESLVAKEKSNLQKLINEQKGSLLKNISEKILEDNQKKYYIGKIIIDTKNINPSTYLGFGTWEKWGEGRVPVGVDLEAEEFKEVEKIGGEKQHTLTVAEMPEHKHKTNGQNAATLTADVPGWQKLGNGTVNVGRSDLWASTALVGENQGHNNLQPYITCYMWKRVA